MTQMMQKELMTLRDQMQSEQMLNDKLSFYAVQTANPQLKSLFTELQQSHQKHFQTLMKHLTAKPIQ